MTQHGFGFEALLSISFVAGFFVGFLSALAAVVVTLFDGPDDEGEAP